ncbi:MAG: hypothetical protein AAF409_07310 [Pseudomonadota bacterium]
MTWHVRRSAWPMVFAAHPEEVQGKGVLILLLILSTVCYATVPLFV